MCGCMPLSLLFLVSFNSPFRSSSSFLSSSFSFLHSFCYRFTSLSCSGRGKKTRCHSSLHPSLLFHSSRQNSLQTVITMRTRRFFFFFSSSSSSLSPSSPSSCFHLKDLDLSSSSRESLSSASPSSSYTSCCSLFFPSKIPLSPPIPHCHSRTSSSSLFPLLLHASSPPLPSPLSSSSCLSCPFFSSLHSLPSLRRAPLSLISPACLSPTCFSFSSSSPPDRKKNRESSSSFSSSSSSSSPTPSLASPSLSILTHEEHLSLDAILNLVNSLLKDKHFVSFAHVHTPQHPASSAGLTPGEFIVCLHRIAEAYKRTNDKDLLLSSASSFEKTEDEEDSAERKRKRTLSRDFRFRLLLRKVQNRLLSFTAVELYRLLVALSRLGYCPRELLSSILRLLAPEPPLPSSLQASSLSSSSNISFSSPPPESLRNLSSLQLSHLPILLSSLVSRANSEENENLRTFLIAYTSYVSSTLLSQVSPSSPSSSLSQEERKEEEEEQNVDIEEGQQQEKEERRSSSSSLRDPSSTSSLHLSQKDQRETPSSSSCSPLHPHHFSSASSPSLESPPKSFSLNDLSFIAIGMSTLGYRDLSFLSLLAEAVTCELEKRQEREGEEESLESRGKNLAGGDRRRRAGERGQEGEEEEDFLLIRKSRECLPLVNCLFSFATLGILHPRLYHCLFSSLRQNLKFLTSSQLANTTLAVASLTALGEASSFFPFAFLSSLETALEERCSAGGRKREGERKGRSSSLSLFYLEREEAATLAWALCSLRLYEGNPGLFTKLLFHASPYIPNAAAFTPAAAIDRREDERSLVDEEEEEEVQKEDQEEEEEEIIQHLQQIRIDLRLSSSPSIKRFYQDDRRTPEEKRLWNWLVGTDANVDAVDVDACGDARSSLETEERKRRSIDDADKHDNDHDEDEQKEEEEKKKNRRRIEGRREREDSSQIPSDVLQAEAQIYDLLENDQNLLLRLLHQSSEEKTAKDTKCIFMTAVSSELSSHSISPSSFTLSPDASSSSSSVSSSPHLADDQEDLGLYSSHDRDRSGTLVDRSRLCLEKGGIACGFYRCSLIAHYKNEPRIEKEAEIRSFEKEKGPERDIEERDASCIRKLAVIVDFTTFADLSGPTDIFLAMKYRHILLSNYSLIIVRFAEWKELSSDEERKAYLFANVVNQRRDS
ncbi:rap domain protein [Cystoisospora suis]|uniref:Rap domain protein n=1 Tax=Cystoisospora suis TaxID=483139 RepID=A0A2C6KW44_9APIC|nr:rap domain protein [Cystoisospora suis]